MSAMNDNRIVRVFHHFGIIFCRFWIQSLHNSVVHVEVVQSICFRWDSSLYSFQSVEQERVDYTHELLDVAFWWWLSAFLGSKYAFWALIKSKNRARFWNGKFIIVDSSVVDLTRIVVFRSCSHVDY